MPQASRAAHRPTDGVQAQRSQGIVGRLLDQLPRDHISVEDLDAFLQRRQISIICGFGIFGLVAVSCGLVLSYAMPGSSTGRRVPFDSLTPEPISNPAEVRQQVAWLGAPAKLWQTARGTGELIEQKADVLFVPNFAFDGPVINVTGVRGQKLAGFGGAFSEASARVFRELPEDQQRMVLEGYFGSDGIGYTLGRVDMATDFQREDSAEDWSRERRVQLPFVRAASNMLKAHGRKLQLWATQWSPPTWMQTNSEMSPPPRPCFREMNRETWAQNFVDWVSAYGKEGLPIWAVTAQHFSSEDALSEACLLTPAEEADFLGTLLGPRLNAAHPDVQVFMSHHAQKSTNGLAELLRAHPTAASYTAGVAFQGSTEKDLEALQRFRREVPNSQLLASEALDLRRLWRRQRGSTLTTGHWSSGEDYAHDIMGDLNAGSVGWIDWNLLINDQRIGPNHVNSLWDAAMSFLADSADGEEPEDNVWDAAMMADLSTGQVHRHPQYYFIGHFSKFILPGSVHLESGVSSGSLGQRRRAAVRGSNQQRMLSRACRGEDGLESTSFLRPDGLIATVVLNCGSQHVSFKLAADQRAAHASIPPHAIQTYLFESQGTTPFRASGAPFVGVNLGGWLVLEEWMWAAEMKDKGVQDEWSLVQHHGGPGDSRAIRLMEEHWDSFVTEADLDRLLRFGITHVRVPIGFWLVDYDPADGYVDGGQRYLTRLLGWLAARGMRCVLDLHAVPGAQVSNQSFTGHREKAEFFTIRRQYERGKRAMLKLAQLSLAYELHPATAGVIVGIELVNEPGWKFWDTSPGIRELYETMVPQIRRFLPAQRYSILLSFMDSPRTTGSAWLAQMRAKDPATYEGVIYDAHVYHSYGDDNKKGRAKWSPEVDSCKTCCRDAAVLAPVVDHGVPMIVGEYSLNTGFPGGPDFYAEYFRNQLSLFASLPNVLGSFFWNHRILRHPGGWYKEMSLLDLMSPDGPLLPVSQLNLTVRCPGKDLSKCPSFNPEKVFYNDQCEWQGPQDMQSDLILKL